MIEPIVGLINGASPDAVGVRARADRHAGRRAGAVADRPAAESFPGGNSPTRGTS